jgi:hypothetical protein
MIASPRVDPGSIDHAPFSVKNFWTRLLGASTCNGAGLIPVESTVARQLQ